MDEELVEVRIVGAGCSIWVKLPKGEVSADAKETLKMIREVENTLGPSEILDNLSLVLGGSIQRIDLVEAESIKFITGEAAGEYRLQGLEWARGKTLAEVDPKLLRYAVDMGEAAVDKVEILAYLERIKYKPTFDDNNFEDDEIPF